MKNKISIIVPTYNVEKYIAKCLDSLVKQDYPNFDVLVINDGSPYNEQIIIDEYQKKYPNIIKSIVKENGGYGSVLELGIKVSDADYILVCDPDDYLEYNALSVLYDNMQKFGADLVVGAKNLVYSDNDEIKYDKSFNEEYGTLLDGHLYKKGNKEFETLYFIEPSPHAKLYRKDIVSNIKFPHKVSYTDNLLYFYTLSKVEKVVYVKEALSYYLINREGNTRTDLKPTVIDAWVTVFKNILTQVNDADDIFYYRMFEGVYSIFYKVEQINADDSVKKEKYELIYTIIPLLIDHRNSITKYVKQYNQEGEKMLQQKLNLLDKEKSKIVYDTMVKRKINGSLKDNVKKVILNNKNLAKMYEKYHFFAKYFYTRNNERIILNKDVKSEVINDNGTNFFGYYDKPCVAYGHSLYHYLDSSSLSLDQNIKIMVDDKEVSSTNAWNWQQGSMATWIDDKHIIHNFFDGKEYRSKLVDIDTLESTEYVFPIYSLSKDKSFALSLSFSRLAKLRPDYGYFNLPYQKLKDDNEDGIFYLDLKENKVSLFISLKEIAEFNHKENMNGAIHKVNHIDISPNSDKAIFLHRWYQKGIKYTRLLCINIKTKELSVLAENDMVSHMAWVDNNLVFGYLRGKNDKDGYYFIDMNGNQKMFDHSLLVDDGHPTVLNERYIVTDTYPDYTCMSKLLLIDTKTKEVTLIGRFYSGIKYQGVRRCDLHPRFDLEGNGLTIDTVLDGRRKVYHLDIDKLIKK